MLLLIVLVNSFQPTSLLILNSILLHDLRESPNLRQMSRVIFSGLLLVRWLGFNILGFIVNWVIHASPLHPASQNCRNHSEGHANVECRSYSVIVSQSHTINIFFFYAFLDVTCAELDDNLRIDARYVLDEVLGKFLGKYSLANCDRDSTSECLGEYSNRGTYGYLATC